MIWREPVEQRARRNGCLVYSRNRSCTIHMYRGGTLGSGRAGRGTGFLLERNRRGLVGVTARNSTQSTLQKKFF